MDQRIESFLADVLALAGEQPDTVREGVRLALADCEAIFRAQEANKSMVKLVEGAPSVSRSSGSQVACACRALCRSRIVLEMHQHRGTRIAEHLKLVLSVIDRQVH